MLGKVGKGTEDETEAERKRSNRIDEAGVRNRSWDLNLYPKGHERAEKKGRRGGCSIILVSAASAGDIRAV